MGLPQINRLKHHRDFRLVYERGESYRGSHLILRALPPSTSQPDRAISPARIGLSVSQKVSKKAVDRNRIKRQLRAAFRELLPAIAPGWRLAIVVKPKATRCKYEHYLRELKELLLKAGILHGH